MSDPEQAKRIAELEDLVERLKKALLQVEEWSFREGIPPAGYEQWVLLIHPDAKRMSAAEARQVLRQLDERPAKPRRARKPRQS